MSSQVPYGLSSGSLKCIRNAIENMLPSVCTQITILNSKKGNSGILIMCNGEIIKATINGNEVEYSKFFEKIGDDKDIVTVLFSAPPPEVSSLSEMTADSLITFDTESHYISSAGIVALGKAVLGLLYRLEALGIEITDFSLQVKKKIAFLRIESNEDVPWSRIEEIALEYLSPLGVKRVVPG
ncbi:hypothetical protein EYM_07680 [Ignicoccus islandicus DSM 13165]|uniref:Uncharacterized protein n=1 Tax=Ignicoccus islandicus DSM 13165 TaxID=940295 RepID=A0A0U2U9W8_9CREN|nr:hypothetical protein [Ignicoccus islandicus]ALU12804.1 hypothetical protein EYM_07680 [Ignicoccus islandicus DSM 13165]